MENEKELALIYKKFGEYYGRAKMNFPDKVEQREWGFGGWEKKIEVRHFKFVSGEALQAYLAQNAPLYCSYSVAYYKEADARPIEKKGWLGAEVVFDLDADSMGFPCIARHGKGWVCDECLEGVKAHTLRLIDDFLIPDFGVANEDIIVKFSGNRGYHVHVKSEEMKRLGAYGRREMLDYIAGTGLNFDALFRKEGVKLVGPRPEDAGWAGKVARYAITRDLTGVLPSAVSQNVEKMDAFRRGVQKGNWDSVRVPKKEQVWKSFVDGLGLKLGGDVDKQVTGDVTKLIRAPDTLHGETALIAKSLKLSEMEKFDALKDAAAFSLQADEANGIDGKEKAIDVEVREAPALRFGDSIYGPYKGERVKLPEQVALYLICKKQAKIQ